MDIHNAIHFCEKTLPHSDWFFQQGKDKEIMQNHPSSKKKFPIAATSPPFLGEQKTETDTINRFFHPPERI
jgi:hypothetical protein